MSSRKRNRAAGISRAQSGSSTRVTRAVMERLEDRRLLTAATVATLFLPNMKSPELTNPPSLADTTNDLLLNLQPLSTGTNATDYVPTFEGGPISNLTNGTTQNLVNGVPDGNSNDSSSMTNAVFDRDGDPTPTGLNPAATWQATYMLDLTGHRNGYNINEIDSITGHQDTRTDQTIDVWVLPVGADPTIAPGSTGGWVDLAASAEDPTNTKLPNNFAYRPGTGEGSGQLKIVDADTSTTPPTPTGLPMATKIQGVMFIALDPGAVFRELIVKGVPAAETAVPAAPPTLTANPGNQGVSLSWSAAPGAASYNVYRGTTPGGESATPVATNITGTTYNDTGLTNGTTYYYVVKGVNAVGVGAASPEASANPHLAAPAAPTNLAATNQYQAVQLTWTAAPFATSYNVYRGTTAGGEAATPIATGVAGTTFNDTTVVGGTTYYYKVTGVNTAGEGANSNEANIAALHGAEAHYYNEDWWVGPSVNTLFDQGHTSINGIDINWSLGPPDGRITHFNGFSTIFTGKIIASTTGSYTFISNSQDDGILYVNDTLVSEDLGAHGQRNAGAAAGAGQTFPIDLTAGQTYDFIFLQNKRTIAPTTLGGAGAHLEWITPDNTAGTPAIIPESNLIAQSSTPAAPTGLASTATTPDSVTLKWTDNSPSEINYVIERSTDNFANPANTTTAGRTFIDGTSFTDTGLTPGTTYYYRVHGLNFDATGGNSTVLTVATPARPAGGSISGSVAPLTADVDLGATGKTDWIKFGAAGNMSPLGIDQKAAADGTTPVGLIGSGFTGFLGQNLGDTLAGQNESRPITDEPQMLSWTDGGTPDTSGGDNNGIEVETNPGDGFEITAPADATFRELKVYVDERNAVGQLQARLSDGGDVSFVDGSLPDTGGGIVEGVYTIDYKASGPNQKLIVDWTMKTDMGDGRVSIAGATLAPGQAPTTVRTLSDAGGVTYTFTKDADGNNIDVTGGTVTAATKVDPAGLTITDTGAPDNLVFTGGTAVPKKLILGGTFQVSSDTSLSQLQGYLKSGQIKSSSTTAGNALADVVVPGTPGTQLNTRLSGDLNGDGKVNFADLVGLAASYGKTGQDWSHGDLNYDGAVGFADLVALAAHYGQSFTAASGGGTSAALSAAVQVGTKSAAHHASPARRKR